jgi:hypothetical protein
MKLFSLTALALVALLGQALAQTVVPAGAVKLGKVQPAIVKTPEYQITGGQNKRYKLGNWMEIETDFSTVPEEIDELTFKYTVMVEKHLLTGEVTYVNIPKDREHFAVMYVAPRTLDKLSGGKPLTGASIENVWVEVSHSGQVLDKTSFKPGQIPNLPIATGLVLNKEQTPFAPLYFDRYETIKSATH